jgi:hypothetical protein
MSGKKTIKELRAERERADREIARMEEEEREAERKKEEKRIREVEKQQARERQEKAEKAERAKELAARKKAKEAQKAKPREPTATLEDDEEETDVDVPAPAKKSKAPEKSVEKSGAATVGKGKKRDREVEVPVAKRAAGSRNRCQRCANLRIECVYASGGRQKSCDECVARHETCYEEGTQRPPKRTRTRGGKQEGSEDGVGPEFDVLVETMVDVKEEVQKLEGDVGELTQIVVDGLLRINTFNKNIKLLGDDLREVAGVVKALTKEFRGRCIEEAELANRVKAMVVGSGVAGESGVAGVAGVSGDTVMKAVEEEEEEIVRDAVEESGGAE